MFIAGSLTHKLVLVPSASKLQCNDPKSGHLPHVGCQYGTRRCDMTLGSRGKRLWDGGIGIQNREL